MSCLDLESPHFRAGRSQKPTPEHSIDRKDNALGYTPENCRWATKHEQNVNRSTTVYVDYYGAPTPLCELAVLNGLTPDIALRRYRNGWPVERVLNTPCVRRVKT